MKPQETNMLETAYRYGLAHPGITPVQLADYVAKFYRTDRTNRIDMLARWVYENQLCTYGEWCNQK